MAGQAIVTIKEKQWAVNVANTFAELAQGLSGLSSIPAGTGMLFDLGYDRQTIQIDMSQMLFPLDIVFINSSQGVVGVMNDVEPGMTDVRLENEKMPGARYFLEVNAGEAQGIADGDSVNLQGSTATQTSQIDFGSLLTFMIFMMMMVMINKLVSGSLKLPWGKGASLPAVATKAPSPATKTEEEELQERKLTFENKGKGMASEAGVEFLRLDEGWQAKYWTPMYWFKDAKGNQIKARDLEELKGKLSIIEKIRG